MAKGKKTGGRKVGSLNKLTKTVRDTFSEVFNEIQNDPKIKLSSFAKNYPKEFYQIASKLIPTEITGKDGKDLIPITTKVTLPGGTIIEI